MQKRARSQGMPEVLAVREDHTDDEQRSGGAPAPSDVLAVYLEGGSRYRLDDRTYAFEPPMAGLVPEGTLDVDLQEGRVDGIFVLFKGRGLLSKSTSPKGRVVVHLGGSSVAAPYLKKVSAGEGTRLANVLQEIASIEDVNVAGQMRRVSLLLDAVAMYCDIGTEDRAEGVHREAARLRELIEARAFQRIPMSGIYRELDISAAHAGVLFKAAYGVSPAAYRIRLRLNRARGLLVSSRLNVGQVAYEVGFSDALYFSRVFRRRFGVAPSSLIHDFEHRRR